MTLLSRFRITVRVVRHAVMPHPQKNLLGPSISDGPIEIGPDAVGIFMDEPEKALGAGGQLLVFFPGCLVTAAPFVLFRLKRRGYSSCRAWTTSAGLFVSGRR